MADVGAIKTVAEGRLRPAEPGAVARFSDIGGFFTYDPELTEPDDGGKNYIRITNQPKGGWRNETRSTKFFNASEQITSPLKALGAKYKPTGNPYIIDFRHVGFTEPPLVVGLEILEPQRANLDYAKANIVEVTKTQIKIHFIRPRVNAVGAIIASVVEAIITPANNYGDITLNLRLEGI